MEPFRLAIPSAPRNEVGIHPVSRFRSIFSAVRLAGLPNSAGTEPLNLL